MNWVIRSLKRLAIWTAILFAGLIALIAAVYWMAPYLEESDRRRQEEKRAKQQEWEEGWQKWWDEHQTVDNGGKQPSNKGKKSEPAPGWKDGFTAGYISGFEAARRGAVKPSTAEVNGLARGQATKADVPAGERDAWIMGFGAGWTFGWSKGN
jgi:hypothetical protein